MFNEKFYICNVILLKVFLAEMGDVFIILSNNKYLDD